MEKVKTFSNVNYMALRSEVIRWFDEHPEVELLDVLDSDVPLDKNGPSLKVKSIIYRERR